MVLLLLLVMMVIVPDVDSFALALLVEPLNFGLELVFVPFFVSFN